MSWRKSYEQQENIIHCQSSRIILNVSPRYLSGLLKSLTGKSTQEHIHENSSKKRRKNFRPPIYRLVKSRMSQALNMGSLSTNYLKVKSISFRWSFGRHSIDTLCGKLLDSSAIHLLVLEENNLFVSAHRYLRRRTSKLISYK